MVCLGNEQRLTPHPRSGAAAKRSYPTPEGQGQRPGGANSPPRSGGCAGPGGPRGATPGPTLWELMVIANDVLPGGFLCSWPKREATVSIEPTPSGQNQSHWGGVSPRRERLSSPSRPFPCLRACIVCYCLLPSFLSGI